MADFVPGYEASAWFGVRAPKNMPGEIVDRLKQGDQCGFADPKLKVRFADLGVTVLPGSPPISGSSSLTNRKMGQGDWAANIKL
jgi:hypothetical protein